MWNDGEQERWTFACATGNSDQLPLYRFAGCRVYCQTASKHFPTSGNTLCLILGLMHIVSSISSCSSSAFPVAFCTENKTKEGKFSTEQVLRVIITCNCHIFMLFVQIYMKIVGSASVDIYRLFTLIYWMHFSSEFSENTAARLLYRWVVIQNNRPQRFDSITGLQDATATVWPKMFSVW